MMIRTLVAVILSITATTSLAHDFWINKGRYVGPKDGIHCCGEGDCFEISPSNIKPTTAGYLILTSGELVPYSEATPSEDQKFWRCKKPSGERRCFFAPTGAM